jgi:hypothetical protein
MTEKLHLQGVKAFYVDIHIILLLKRDSVSVKPVHSINKAKKMKGAGKPVGKNCRALAKLESTAILQVI